MYLLENSSSFTSERNLVY